MSHRSIFYQSLSNVESTPPPSNSQSPGTEKRLGRKSWRTMGIRLNTEMTLQGVEISDIRLGSGSFGARDVRVAEWCGAKVAAKTILPPTDEVPQSPAESSLDFGRNITPYQRRVLQECNLMGRLCHPNIAQLHGVFIDAEGRPVVISELLSESLAQRIAFGPRLSFRDVLDVSIQVLSALIYLHSLPHPVVHGSLCSSNVLMSYSGVVKLTDTNLALAKLYSASSGAATGSVHLDLPGRTQQLNCTQHSEMAERYLPFMAGRDCYDTSVDCYSLAVLLMAMCLHREPRLEDVDAQNGTVAATAKHLSELERRAKDLEALRQAAPLIEPLVTVCIDDSFSHQNGGASPGGSGGNSNGNARPSVHEILKNVEGIASSDEYRRWPCTLGSAFAHSSRRQAELEMSVGMLQRQVQATVDAARSALDSQAERVAAQMKQLSTAHGNQVVQLRRRLMEARSAVQQSHASEAQERRERRMAESVRDSVTRQLEALRAGSGSPRSLTASSSFGRGHGGGVGGGGGGHSDMDAGDEGSVDMDGGEIMLSPLRANGVAHVSTLSVDDIDLGNTDYSELSMEVSVQVPNDGVKLVAVEDTITVQEIIASLCETNGLADADGYCMYIDEDNFGATKEKSEKTSRGRKFDIWKRKSSAEEPQLSHGAVLNNECTLDQQGILPHPQLLLQMRRRSEILASSGECDIGDSGCATEEDCDMDFDRCSKELSQGKLLCTHEEAVNILAFHAQAMYGNQNQHSKEYLKAIAEAMKEAVSCISLKTKNIKKLMHKYTLLADMSMAQAKTRYVQHCKGLPTFNATIHHVKERLSKKDRGKVCILALTPRTMYKLDDKTKEVTGTWLMKNLFRARATGELLTIESTERATLIVSTPDAGSIAEFIKMYKSPDVGSPPSLTFTEATPKHSPLRQSLSNNTIIHSSPKSSPRLVQQLSIRRTESATVIRKVSPNTRLMARVGTSDNLESTTALQRLRSQSTSSATKPKTAPKKPLTNKDGESDSSEERQIIPSSLPTFGGSNPLLTSSNRSLHHPSGKA